MQQLLLQNRNVVIQSRRENDVLARRRNELDHLIHVLLVAVGKKLRVRRNTRINHIGLIDDERMHIGQQILRVKLQVVQQQLGRRNHNIGVLVQQTLLHITHDNDSHLLLHIRVIQSHAVHLIAAKASEALKAVVRLHAQLLRRNEDNCFDSLRASGKSEDLLDRRDGIGHRLSRTRSGLHENVLSRENQRNGLRLQHYHGPRENEPGQVSDACTPCR